MSAFDFLDQHFEQMGFLLCFVMVLWWFSGRWK